MVGQGGRGGAGARIAGLAGGLALLVTAWWAAALLVPGGFVPAPGAVLLRFLVLFPGALAAHTAASLGRIAAALALALLTAVPAGSQSAGAVLPTGCSRPSCTSCTLCRRSHCCQC